MANLPPNLFSTSVLNALPKVSNVPAAKPEAADRREAKADLDSQAEIDKSGERAVEQKLFFWDSILLYLASTILGLSISNIVVDFLRPEPNTVTCFTPSNYTINQANYVNNYCNNFLPFSENFSLALVAHGVLLLVPQYLWKAYFSARIDFFFSHATKLETLRERDTGEYPHRNFNIVDYMHREFLERKDILIGYYVKLGIQLIIVVVALSVSNVLFQNFTIEFDCSHHETANSSHLMGVICTYPKLQFVSILRWIDYALLVLAFLSIFYGFGWCLLRNHQELAHQDISLFCFNLCINSKHYKAKKHYFLKNDLHFLLVSLFATNAGLGRVFRSVQIANDISQRLSAHLESLDNYDSMKYASIHSREPDMKKNCENIFREEPFGKAMLEICEAISKKSGRKMGGMDIGCGYHSYLFAIARWQFQTFSIILDPYYRNQKVIFTSEEHHSCLFIMRIPTNLFGLPKKHKNEFSNKIQTYAGLKEPDDVESVEFKLGLVVIGPIDSNRKVSTVNQIIELHSRSPDYFVKGSIMIILRPLEVEGKDISGSFEDWTPESIGYWESCNSLKVLRSWLGLDQQDDDDSDQEQPKSVILVDEHNSDEEKAIFVVECENLKCKFALKIYSYKGYYIETRL